MKSKSFVSFMIVGGLLTGCVNTLQQPNSSTGVGSAAADVAGAGGDSTGAKLAGMVNAANAILTTDKQSGMPPEVLEYDRQLLESASKVQKIYATQGQEPTPAWVAKINAAMAARSQAVQNYYAESTARNEAFARALGNGHPNSCLDAMGRNTCAGPAPALGIHVCGPGEDQMGTGPSGEPLCN